MTTKSIDKNPEVILEKLSIFLLKGKLQEVDGAIENKNVGGLISRAVAYQKFYPEIEGGLNETSRTDLKKALYDKLRSVLGKDWWYST